MYLFIQQEEGLHQLCKLFEGILCYMLVRISWYFVFGTGRPRFETGHRHTSFSAGNQPSDRMSNSDFERNTERLC